MNKTFKSSNKLREQILDIAFRHFIQFGFARTTLTGIAGMLGKQKTVLYYYFRNKEEIFSAIVRIEAENFLDELSRILKDPQDEIECLNQYITRRVIAMHNVASKYKVLKDELFYLLPEIEKAREPFHLKEVHMVAEVLERGMRKGVIRPMEADQLAMVIVNTLKGLEIPMYVKNEMKYDKREIDGFVSLLLFGVATIQNDAQNQNYENSLTNSI